MHFREWELLYFDPNFTELCPIDMKWACVQVMAWRRTGDKPLPETMFKQFTDAYSRHCGGLTNGLTGFDKTMNPRNIWSSFTTSAILCSLTFYLLPTATPIIYFYFSWNIMQRPEPIGSEVTIWYRDDISMSVVCLSVCLSVCVCMSISSKWTVDITFYIYNTVAIYPTAWQKVTSLRCWSIQPSGPLWWRHLSCTFWASSSIVAGPSISGTRSSWRAFPLLNDTGC